MIPLQLQVRARPAMLKCWSYAYCSWPYVATEDRHVSWYNICNLMVRSHAERMAQKARRYLTAESGCLGEGEKSPTRTMFAFTLRSRIIPSDQRPRRLALLASLVTQQNIVLTVGTSPIANVSWMDHDRSRRRHLLHCWRLGTLRLLGGARTGHDVSGLWLSLPSAKSNGEGHGGPD